MIRKHLLLPVLTIFVAASVVIGCSDGRKIDDRDFWETATADDMKSVMDDWRDAQGKDGEFTPLHYAVLYSARSDFVRDLLDNGADVNARYDNQYSDMNGWTPLHMATFRGDSTSIETLLNMGADIEAKDASGATALHIAALYGIPESAEVLLRRGSNIAARAGGEEFDGRYYSLGAPLHLAARQSKVLYNGDFPILVPANYLYPGVLERKPEVVEILLAYGARTDMGDEGDMTPLHWAVTVDIDKDSPHTAIKRGTALEITELLLDHGAGVNASTPHGGWFLAEKVDGIDITAREGFHTSLHAAAGSDAGVAIVAMLLNHGRMLRLGTKEMLHLFMERRIELTSRS